MRGEGEITFLELVKALLTDGRIEQIQGIDFIESKNDEVVSTEVRALIPQLDDLPFPEIEDLSWDKYGQWTLFTSRGCPFKCMYCSSAAYWKHSIRYHSAERVVAEICRLVEQFGASDIYIADDTFTLNKNRIYEICSKIINRNINVRWSCLTRADCVDEDLLQQMSRAGCVLISFGVETVKQATLNLVKKNISFEKVGRALKLCTKYGIRTRVSMIIGLPEETETDVLATLEFLLRNQPNEIQLYGLTPHDGTALYENLADLGVRILENDSSLWSRNVLKPVCETTTLSREQIVNLALRFLEELQKVGYTYINDEMKQKKIAATKTVATSFSPVQVIGGVKAI